MPPPILEFAIIEISADHRGSMPLCTVLLPLAIIVVTVAPSINTISMLLALLIIALESISILILHDPFPMVFSIFKLPFVNAVPLLAVLAFAVKFVILPLSRIRIAIFVAHLTIPTLDILCPIACVSRVRSFLCAIPRPISMVPFAVI